LFFDKESKAILRITSELFDLPVRIDIVDLERIENTVDVTVGDIH